MPGQLLQGMEPSPPPPQQQQWQLPPGVNPWLGAALGMLPGPGAASLGAGMPALSMMPQGLQPLQSSIPPPRPAQTPQGPSADPCSIMPPPPPRLTPQTLTPTHMKPMQPPPSALLPMESACGAPPPMVRAAAERSAEHAVADPYGGGPPYPAHAAHAAIPLLSAVAVARAQAHAGGWDEGPDERQSWAASDASDVRPDLVGEGRLAPFLTKLYNLVSSPATDAAVRWTEDGAAIEVIDQQRLARDVLPRFFKHNKLGTFTQQLHTYGFIRRGVEGSTTADHVLFSHEHFKRGDPAGLYRIRRSASGTMPPSGGNDDRAPSPATALPLAAAGSGSKPGAAGAGAAGTGRALSDGGGGVEGASSAPDGGVSTSEDVSPSLMLDTMRALEEALTQVESIFAQHRHSTRQAMIAIGAALTERQPQLTSLISAVVSSRFEGDGADSGASGAASGSDAAGGGGAASCEGGRDSDVSDAAQHRKEEQHRATLRHLTAVAEDARSEDMSGGGSDDGRGSDERESGGVGSGSGSEHGEEHGHDDGHRSGSEDRGSDPGSEKSGNSGNSGNSGGNASNSSNGNGSAAGSSSSGNCSNSSKAVSSSSAEPRSDVSDRSGSNGGPSTSISSG